MLLIYAVSMDFTALTIKVSAITRMTGVTIGVSKVTAIMGAVKNKIRYITTDTPRHTYKMVE